MDVRQGFVEVEGHRLAYLAVNEHAARADQPAVVFVHGVLVSVNFWLDAVPPDFRDKRAWYALGLPAHYPSTVAADFNMEQVDASWFYRVMNGGLEQLLNGRKAIVVGHSTGGFCALNMAIHHAPSVAGIVSIAGFHRGTWGGVEGLLLRLAGMGRWARPFFTANLALAQRSALVRHLFASLLAHDWNAFRKCPLSLRMLENVAPDARRQDPVALFHLFHGISRLEIGHRLREIEVPCHTFAGSHDPVVSAAQSRRIATEVPGANKIVFRNVGHMPFMESTEQYYAALEHALMDIVTRTEAHQTAQW